MGTGESHPSLDSSNEEAQMRKLAAAVLKIAVCTVSFSTALA
jgi:hypothetical protein